MKMKSLLFAAFALSLILVVSSQCDINAVTTCTQDYARMVSKLDLQLCVCVQLLLQLLAWDSHHVIQYSITFTRRKFSPIWLNFCHGATSCLGVSVLLLNCLRQTWVPWNLINTKVASHNGIANNNNYYYACTQNSVKFSPVHKHFIIS